MNQELISKSNNSVAIKKIHGNNIDQGMVDTSFLQSEISWLSKLIQCRTTSHLKKTDFDHALLELQELGSDPYSNLIQKYNFGLAERLVIALSVMANIKPESFDYFLSVNPQTGKPFREYGGVISKSTYQFRPTLRTAIYLLSGNDQESFINYQNILCQSNKLFTEQIVNLYTVEEHIDYYTDNLIQLDSAYIDLLFAGKTPRLDSGSNFPAKLLETSKTFDDLVLKEATLEKLKPAMNYVRVQQELYTKTDINSKIKSGFVLLLSGPPGTGKTLTAAILGNELNTQVYQIDSSLVVSKYIGETEKNLERVFKRLEGKNCILFFDEADAMFGKRTEILDSKDRYANQGVSYLLQRIEKFDGLVILATNHENNFDEAFKRRILSRIHIGRPDIPERIKLWNCALPKGYTYSSNELVTALSEHFEFTGANIAVVVKMSIEQAFSENKTELSFDLMNPFLEIVGREALGTDYKPLILNV